MKNLKTYDMKHQNPKPIQNVTDLSNYEVTDLQNKMCKLHVAVKRETSEITQLK